MSRLVSMNSLRVSRRLGVDVDCLTEVATVHGPGIAAELVHPRQAVEFVLATLGALLSHSGLQEKAKKWRMARELTLRAREVHMKEFHFPLD